MFYSGPDRLDVFHHTAATPLAYLQCIGDRGEGWYTIHRSGCLVSVDGPFATEQEARHTGAASTASRSWRSHTRTRGR